MLNDMFKLNQNGFDEQSIKILGDEISKHLNSKFDYLKFREAINGLIELKIDETTAILSTLTTAKTMGVSKGDIVDSATQLKEIINSEKLKFETALNLQLEQRVENLKLKMDQNLENIAKIEHEIIELKNKIEFLTTENSNLTDQISEGSDFIKSKEDLFIKTTDKLKELIENDILKLSQITTI